MGPTRSAATSPASSAGPFRGSRAPQARGWAARVRSSGSHAATRWKRFRWRLVKMITLYSMKRAVLGTMLAAGMAATVSSQAIAQGSRPVAPVNEITLSQGTGRLVRLPAAMTDVFVADSRIADVQVRSANQIFIFGKEDGQTSVFATDRS